MAWGRSRQVVAAVAVDVVVAAVAAAGLLAAGGSPGAGVGIRDRAGHPSTDARPPDGQDLASDTDVGRTGSAVRVTEPTAAGRERSTAPVGPAVGDTADPLLAATAAYLASPAGRADAWLLTYAGEHPPERYWTKPGGCAAWFAGATPPEGGGGLLTGEPPAAPAFGGYVSSLRLARLDMVFRRVRCASDPTPGSLTTKLEDARHGWESLAAYAAVHGLTVPDPDPPAPALPPAPLLVTGTGSRTVLVQPPVRAPGEPFLLTLVVGSPGSTVTTVGASGIQETFRGTGTQIADRDQAHRTTAISVTADGPWQVRLESFALMRRGALPGSIQGTGNDVVLVDVSMLGAAGAAIVDGVARVTVHRSQEPAQPLAGRVPDADVVVLEVHADGPWTIRTP